ncbi:MAG TPA: MarR family transcriptional regulator [Armatimonadota bacterium]|jgi:DNA-binding MarR family transcriptional regulator
MQELKKDSPAYVEHLFNLFVEVLHETVTVKPLQNVGAEMTPALAQGLQFLSRHGVCSIRDIAQGLQMTYSAASQLTERLVKRGLVTRRENERDRRLSEIKLTEDGLQVVERIRVHRIESITHILDRMNEARRLALVGDLESFIAAAIENEKSALKACSHCGTDHLAECVVNEIYKAATGTPIDEI